MNKVKTIVAVLFCSSVFILQACSEKTSNIEQEQPQNTVDTVQTETVEPSSTDSNVESKTLSKTETETTNVLDESKKTEKVSTEKPTEKTDGIETSVFVYATKVDVTDARDITQHIDLVVHMNEQVKPGLATQHVFTQAYDFLQQDDIKGAKTITIGVMSGKFRVAQITVDMSKFKPEEHLIKSVLKASTIDKMYPEVKDYGKVMELW